MRRARRVQRRLRYRMGQRIEPVSVELEQVAGAFRALGIGRGESVYLQSAMSRFGRVEGGPATVVGALEEVVGADGLIAMPAFPIAGGAQEHLESDPVFDVRSTPSRMGAISEYFRTLPGTLRSLHPTHSISARGPGARELVEGHGRAPTAFGAGSPFPRMAEAGTWLVAFGTGVHVFTLYHTFEDTRPGGYPLKVYLDRPYTVRCIDEDGRECTVTTPVHDPELAARRIDNDPRVERRLHELLLGGGLMRSVRLGKGEVLAIRAPDLMSELERLLGQGVTIYDVPIPPPDR